MKTDTVNTTDLPEKISEEPKSQFKGYSLEDIRYRRALVALQKEFCKQKALNKVRNLRSHSPFSKNYAPARGGGIGKVGAIAGKLLYGLNYLDYAMLGLSVFSSIRKVVGFFRRRK